MGKHTGITQLTPRLIDEETAAAYLGRGRTKFRDQVSRKQLPGPSDRNGNVPLWDVRLLDRHVDQLSGLMPGPVTGWDL